MFIDSKSPFERLYCLLNFLDPSVVDVTERLTDKAIDKTILKNLLCLWILGLRRTLPPSYPSDLNPLRVFKTVIVKLKHHPNHRIRTDTLKYLQIQLLGIDSMKMGFNQYIKLLKPVMAIPDIGNALPWILIEFEKELVQRRLCADHNYHLYWRQFCILHKRALKDHILTMERGLRDQKQERIPLKTVDWDHLNRWPLDTVYPIPGGYRFEEMDWFEHVRPDKDYNRFAVLLTVILLIIGWRISHVAWRVKKE